MGMKKGNYSDDDEVVPEKVIVAEYGLALHCRECGLAIEKLLLRTPGVREADVDAVAGRMVVRGSFDVHKLRERVEVKTRKKVDLIMISLTPEKTAAVKQKKEQAKTMVVKVNLHCERCEQELKLRIQKLRGVYTVNMDRGAQTCTVHGSIEEKELVEYIFKKTSKRVEVMSSQSMKEEKKVVVTRVEEKGLMKKKKNENDEEREMDDDEEDDHHHEKKRVAAAAEWRKKKEIMSKAVELLPAAAVDAMRVKQGAEEVKMIMVPYFVHCNHAPQWFSDEDPNSCSLM